MLLKISHSFYLFFLFALFPASYAHAGVSPQLGVNGTPKRSDVKRPSNNQPCGSGVNIASALDTSTAVPADVNGNVKVTALNFNPGGDGSRKVTAKVDPSGTGKNFVTMTITVNGDPAPTNTGSQVVIAKLPDGTKCTGGSKKNKCLAQFVTTSGFGNCVVVSQGPNAVNTSSKSSDARGASPNVGPNRVVEDADSLAGTEKEKDDITKNSGKDKVAAKDSKSGGGKKDSERKKGGNKKQAGTRAARALLADLEQ